jgi:hypothetical protein
MRKIGPNILAAFVATIVTASAFAGPYTPGPLPDEFTGGGFIPVKEKHFKAELAMSDAIVKLTQEVLQCDQKAVKNVFQGKADGIEACALKAVARYLAAVEKIIAKTPLPDCLDPEKGMLALSLLPAFNQAVFCEQGPAPQPLDFSDNDFAGGFAPPNGKVLNTELGVADAVQKVIGEVAQCVSKGAIAVAHNEPSGLAECLSNTAHTGALDKYHATIAKLEEKMSLPSCIDPETLRSDMAAFVLEDITPLVFCPLRLP